MEDIKLLNLEDTVGYLVDRAELASIGATLKGKVANYDSLPTGEVGDVYAVGTTAPYSYYAYTENGWLDIGTWPLAGPKGVPGDRGPQGPAGPIGPKGDKGNQGIAGPSGGGVGVDHVSSLNLSTGSASVTYNETTGAALSKSGRITASGTNYDITVNDKLPIIAGDNVNISANTSNNAIKVSANVPVTSVNGQTGAVNITVPTKTSQLTNDSGFITNSYHDSSKQDTLESGKNIKTINNQSIVGPGNITIESGTAGVTSLNNKTGAINIVQGSNVTVNTSGNTITISATGGGSGGTVELPFIELIPDQSTYPINKEFTDSDAEKLTDSYFSSILLKPSGSDYYVPLLPQASQRDSHKYLWEGHDQNYTYTITGTLQKQLDANQAVVWTAKFYTIDQELYSNPNVKQTTGFYRYDGIINAGTAGTEIVVGGTYQYSDTLTLYQYTNGCTYTQGQMIIDRNGVISKVIDPTHARVAYIPPSGGSTYSVVEITSSTTTLTDEQYNTLTASPFNKIKLNNIIYDLYQENSARLVYAANYFNNGYQITITKSTKAVSTGSLSSLTSISSYVKNSLDYNVSNTTYALSAYQGKVLNDRLTAVENAGGSGSATLYQHTLTYSSDKFSDTDQFSGTEVQGQFSISFYSTHGHFETASEFWAWLIGRGSISVSDGQLWGNMGGGDAFTRITVLGETDADKYIQFESYGGYGSWNPLGYFLKNTDATGATDTIVDGFRDM